MARWLDCPDWWFDWLTNEQPMCAVKPWHGDDVADIYNHSAALMIIEERGQLGPDGWPL